MHLHICLTKFLALIVCPKIKEVFRNLWKPCLLIPLSIKVWKLVLHALCTKSNVCKSLPGMRLNQITYVSCDISLYCDASGKINTSICISYCGNSSKQNSNCAMQLCQTVEIL